MIFQTSHDILANSKQTAESHKASNAMHQVFAIFELLEKICLELPIKDLLVNAQRVCKTWREIITQSVKLQQALFLAPLPGPSLQFMSKSGPKTWQQDGNDSNSYTMFGNPFSSIIRITRREDTLDRPNSSWRRMLVSQPSIRVSAYLSSKGDSKGFEFPQFMAFEESGKPESENGYANTGLIFDALTYGDIERVFLSSANCRSATVNVEGCSRWQDVFHGCEVRRIVRPKGPWLRGGN